MHRKKRIAELQARSLKEIYGEVVSISAPEYKEAVETKDTWVVVFLYKPGYVPLSMDKLQCVSYFRVLHYLKWIKQVSDLVGILNSLPACQLMDECLQVLARKCRATKFVKIYSTEVINIPFLPLPALFSTS